MHPYKFAYISCKSSVTKMHLKQSNILKDCINAKEIWMIIMALKLVS